MTYCKANFFLKKGHSQLFIHQCCIFLNGEVLPIKYQKNSWFFSLGNGRIRSGILSSHFCHVIG